MAKHDWEYDSVQGAIRTAAAKLFCANGIHATSLADISREISLSKGTLYYYYPSKDELVQEIAEIHLGNVTAMLFDWLDHIQTDTSAEELVDSLAEMLLADNERIALHFALHAEAAQGNEALRQRFRLKMKEWSVLVEMAATRLTGARGAVLGGRSEMLLCLIEGCGWRKLIADAPGPGAISALFAAIVS